LERSEVRVAERSLASSMVWLVCSCGASQINRKAPALSAEMRPKSRRFVGRRSPDERSDIRGRSCLGHNPGCRFAHPGYTRSYHPLRCPPGEHPSLRSIRSRRNIPLYRNSELSYSPVTSSRSEGRIAIVTKRGVSGGGRGLRRTSNRLVRTTGAVSRTAKSCGPDVRGLYVKSCERSQGDGGNSASLPGESAT